MAEILITGASGMVGRHLIPMLQNSGHNIHILTTQKNKQDYNKNIYYWDPENNILDIAALEKAEIIIHLAGANVGKKRWTKKYKKEILDSRVISAKMLYAACSNAGKFPSRFITAAGIGYYDDPSNELLDEEKPNGHHFLADVCKQWENAAQMFANAGSAVTILRTGPVLCKEDGLLKTYITAAPFHIIPTTGDPENMLSWIHIRDLCAIYVSACNGNLTGIFNAVAPEPCPQKTMVEAIAAALKKKCFFPNVPAFLLKFALGERASLALTSQNVTAEKLQKTGFIFAFNEINSAISDLLHER